MYVIILYQYDLILANLLNYSTSMYIHLDRTPYFYESRLSMLLLKSRITICEYDLYIKRDDSKGCHMIRHEDELAIVTKYCSVVVKVLSLVLFGSQVPHYSTKVLCHSGATSTVAFTIFLLYYLAAAAALFSRRSVLQV